MIGSLTYVIEMLNKINATGKIAGEEADEILAVALAINLEYLKMACSDLRVPKEELLRERIDNILRDLTRKGQSK